MGPIGTELKRRQDGQKPDPILPENGSKEGGAA